MPTAFPPAAWVLLAAVVAAQFADKLALDTITLAATAAGASPRQIGLLVTAQSAAWLLVSLPAGALADRLPPARLILLGGLLAGLGGAAGAALLFAGDLGGWIAASTFLAACGPVLVTLSAFVLMPRLVAMEALPRANGRVELGRAVFSLVAPLLAGWLVTRGQGGVGLLLCVALAGLILCAALRLPATRAPASERPPILRAIAEGGAFVANHGYLRPIALCAMGWNFAFFALTALVAPYAARVLALDTVAIGSASSVYGVGMVLGALAAPRLIARLPTGALLVFGPASSVCAVLLPALAPPSLGFAALAAAFFLFGFGPILWFIVQTSLRQTVTPQGLLGRVSATLTTATFGMRPLGALAGGFAGEAFGLEAAIWLPVAFFALSTLAILVSPLPGLRAMPTEATALPAAG